MSETPTVPRSRCTITAKVLQNLILAHNVTLDDDNFLDRDIEQVVSH